MLAPLSRSFLKDVSLEIVLDNMPVEFQSLSFLIPWILPKKCACILLSIVRIFLPQRQHLVTLEED